MKKYNNELSIDYFNYCAISLLEHLGNDRPTQYEIDMAEEVVRMVCSSAVTPRTLSKNLKSN